MSRHATTWQIEVRHTGLNKYQMVRGTDRRVVEERTAALRAKWDDEWARRCDVEQRRNLRLNGLARREAMKAQAIERTEAAESALASLSSILTDGVRFDCRVDWEKLKDRSAFSEAKHHAHPTLSDPAEPDRALLKYKPRIGILEFFSKQRKNDAIKAASAIYDRDHEAWVSECANVKTENARHASDHAAAIMKWEADRLAFLKAQSDQHESVDARAKAAMDGDEVGVAELIDLALAQSPYPEFLNVNYEVDYAASTKSSVIDYELPAPDALPSLKEVRFIAAREDFAEKRLSDSERAKLYDSTIYQIALRTLHTVFAADEHQHIERVTFNGWVDYVDRATGMDERSCILSVAANRSDVAKIEFSRVDPRECFKTLKGVAASKLIGLAPVAPLERPRLADKRFIESRDIASNVDASINIAAMDWQEFEHLVRQVFQSEFASDNGEVSVTQASRDGGVDAIVFNPDPIKGGKIVIQAKRYTNTVDVGSVRDLYGTVLNEGASKGILVTTSQFGPDARKFAQGKPLTLIDGGNFLFLLEKMGIQARIDLKEAKSLLAESRL